MPQSLSGILLHLVFSTKNRAPLIDSKVQEELWRYMAGICKACGCMPHRVGGMPDHIHMSCSFSRTITVAKLLEEIKKSSSKWMKTKGVPSFGWQNGYGSFSIAETDLGDLVAYIDGQEQHHRKQGFQDEYREFLRKHNVPFDERYMWD